MWQLLVRAGKRLTEVTLVLTAEEGKNARITRWGDRPESLGAPNSLKMWGLRAPPPTSTTGDYPSGAGKVGVGSLTGRSISSVTFPRMAGTQWTWKADPLFLSFMIAFEFTTGSVPRLPVTACPPPLPLWYTTVPVPEAEQEWGWNEPTTLEELQKNSDSPRGKAQPFVVPPTLGHRRWVGRGRTC